MRLLPILLGPIFSGLVSAAAAAESPTYLPDTVVARRGTATVTLADVDAKVSALPPEARAKFLDDPARIEATVSNLLLIKQLAAQARESKLENDVSVAAQIRYATDQILAAARAKQLGDAPPKIDVEKLARESYVADPKRFNEPDLVTARHVLIRTSASRSIDEARALAERVREEALAGKSFEALARERSEDEGSKSNGGLLPEFGPNRMQKPFEEAAYGLDKPGAISPVIKTKFGFHVIQLVERKRGKPRTYEQVKPELTKRLAEEHAQKAKREVMDQLQSMRIEADPDVVASLRTRYTLDPGIAPAAPATEATPAEGGH